MAIAQRESSWNASAHNGNRGTSDNSYGLWQINMLGNMGPSRRSALGLSSNEQLFDPATNAAAAYWLYEQGGDTFHHWGGYKGYADDYSTDRSAALAAVREAGLGDVERAALVSSAGSRGAPMVFNNTFNVSGGAGGGGVDVGRLVTQVADRLEPELRRRALATA